MRKLRYVFFLCGLFFLVPANSVAYDVVGLFLNFPENDLDSVTRIDLHISARPDYSTTERNDLAFKNKPYYIGTILDGYPQEDDYQGALGLDWYRQDFTGGVISYIGGQDTLQSGKEVVVDGYVYENRIPNITDVSLSGYPGFTQFAYYLWMTNVPVQIGIFRINVDVWKVLVEPDSTAPVILLNGADADDQVEWTERFAYQDEGVTAIDNAEGDVTANIVSIPADPDAIDTENAQVGDIFEITYDVRDSSGNVAETRTRTVNIVADRKPVITLNGEAEVNVIRDALYEDAGATATDFEGPVGDIIVTGDVNTSTVGDYFIRFEVSDSKGNEADPVIRTVHVVDEPPVITLLGKTPVEVVVGKDFNDSGATAIDDHDGDISGEIIVGGDVVDTETIGVYRITYNVSDEYGNAADPITRIISVVEAPAGGGGGGGGGCFISLLAGGL